MDIAAASRGEQEQEDEEVGESNENERLASLIVYTVSLIVICLTAFNFYLLAWIWSSLRHDARQSIDFLSSWDELKFRGKLVTERQFKANQINSNNNQQDSNEERKLQISLTDNKEDGKSAGGSSISFGLEDAERDLLKLSYEDGCNFPSGLLVRGLLSGKVALVCAPTKQNQCLVKNQDNLDVRLSNPNIAIDFRRKSVQTNRVKTKRLHSALNELHLMSSNDTLYESLNGIIKVHSMDDLIIASKRANVIIEAKTINLSLVGADSFRQTGKRKGYKLCICLAASSRTTNSTQANNGRLFAIKSDLKCAKFSRSFCQAPA